MVQKAVYSPNVINVTWHLNADMLYLRATLRNTEVQ